MLPIGSKPLLEVIIDYLKTYRFDEVIITINYMRDSIVHYFGDGARFGIRISYSVEPCPLGTAGGVKKVHKSLEDTFIVVLGDVIADIDYDALVKHHKEEKAMGTMVVFEQSLRVPYGVLNLDVD